jgi:hypothetical protein
LLGIKPSPLLEFINKDCEKFGIVLTANQNYSKSLLSPTPLTDLSASANSNNNNAAAVDSGDMSSSSTSAKEKIKFFTPTQLFPMEMSLRSCDKHLQNMKKQYHTLNRSMQVVLRVLHV